MNAKASGQVRHIVMWRVVGDTQQQREEAVAKVRAGFEGLRGHIPGMRHLEIGVDISRIDYACDVVLVTDFESAAALADYAVHPEHLKLRDALTGLRTARYQVDYTLPVAEAT